MRYFVTKHLERFLRTENVNSKILIFCSIVSLLLANLPFGVHYVKFWTYEFSNLSSFHLPNNPALFIDDILMPFFFFLVGAEIRHEMSAGSLNSVKKASLPFLGALGGIIAPAILYSFITKGTDFVSGWGIPTATDIAFSVAVIGILKDRVSKNAKIFLLALAIFDDLGAILIVALFYGGSLNLLYFLIALGCIFMLYTGSKMKQKLPAILFILPSVGLWYSMHLAGIHTTIAGVIIAFLLPVWRLENLVERLQKPIEFVVLPLFILSNTAIIIRFSGADLLNNLPVVLGIIVGLCVGKPLGIFLITRLGLRAKIIQLPDGFELVEVIGIGIVAGVGFTMSLFVANLSFPINSNTLEIAKLSIILSSVASGIATLIWFKKIFKHVKKLSYFDIR